MVKLNEYRTVGEAAELLGVSKNTLRRWDGAEMLKARHQPIDPLRRFRHDPPGLRHTTRQVPYTEVRFEYGRFVFEAEESQITRCLFCPFRLFSGTPYFWM